MLAQMDNRTNGALLSSVAQQIERIDNGGPNGVRVKPDLRFARSAEFATVPSEGDPFVITCRIVWREEEQRYRVADLGVMHHSEFITGTGIRKIAVHELMQQMLGDGVRSIVQLDSGEPVPDTADNRQLWAARTYTIARAIGDAPLRAVAGALGISQSSATRLIAKAREDGLVD